MGKNNFFKSLLFVAVFAAALGACRSDELAVREPSKSKEVVEKADTFSLQLDLPSMSFNSKITAVSDVTMADEANAEGKNTRAALHVKQDGTTTINLTTEGGPLKVLLILRNQDGSKVYVSPNNNWTVVSETKVEASGIYNFTAVKGASGAPTMTKDDVWYLDAMTGGEWDPSTKAYIINRSCSIPKKMFKPGEKVKLGTNMADANTDIVVPFQLGTNDVANAGVRKWGVKMAVANNDRNSSNLTPRLVCIDPHPNFSPYGSLLCMRFRNNTSMIAKNLAANQDPAFNNRTWQPGHYSFLIRGISVESTSSTPGGWIPVDRLAAPDRTPFQWYGFDADGKAYRFDKQTDKPFFKYVKLDGVVDNDYHTGVLLKRGTPGQEDAPWTPYYYVWVKSLDETKSEALYGSAGLAVRLNVYNATLDPATTMHDPIVDPRVVITSRKNHHSGRAYFADASISTELGISPLSQTAVGLLFQNKVNGHVMNFWPPDINHGYVTYPNSEFSKRRVEYEAIVSDLNGYFSVSPSRYDSPNPEQNGLKWMIPTGPMIKSVFPPQMNDINVMKYHGGGEWREMHEDVSIAGVNLSNTLNYYYNPWEYDWKFSKQDNYYHTYFGLRFVGTPYCTVYRYTLFGKWDNMDQAHGTNFHEHTRFVIQARHLGNIPEPSQGWKNFMKEVVAAGNAPSNGNPHKNDFWGQDFWNPSVEKGITTRVLAVPGAPSSKGGGPFAGTGTAARSVGTWLSLAVNKNGNLNNPELQTYDIRETANDGYYYQNYTFNNPFSGGAGVWNRRNFVLSVFPFLAPVTIPEPQWVGERR